MHKSKGGKNTGKKSPKKDRFFSNIYMCTLFLHSFQTGLDQLRAIFHLHYGIPFQTNALNVMRSSICSQSRPLLISGARLCTLLAQRLLCFNGQIAVRHPFGLCRSVLSRRHFFHQTEKPKLKTVLYGHTSCVSSVAVHSEAPLIATGSHDNTAKIWHVLFKGSEVVCVETLRHSSCVLCVAFHPSDLILVTGSGVGFVNLWQLSWQQSSTTLTVIHVATEIHGGCVLCVAFHPTASIFATGSEDGTLKLWNISSDGFTCVKTLEAGSNCVKTLEGGSDCIQCVAFHLTNPILATGSRNGIMKLWNLSSDNRSAICVTTIQQSEFISSIAFHPKELILAMSSSRRNSITLLRFSPDGSNATVVATLQEHKQGIRSVVYNPTGSILATSGYDNTTKLWRNLPDGSNATYLETLAGHRSFVVSAAFHRTNPFLVTGSADGTPILWR